MKNILIVTCKVVKIEMININASRIKNEINQDHFTLYVEWLDSSFNIILLKSEMEPLAGEMTTEDISYFSKELGKSPIEYLTETKDGFCGKNMEIRFFITDECFEWRQKDVWTLGRIKLHLISNIHVLSEKFQQLVISYQDIRTRLTALEAENETLKDIKARLTTSIEEMIQTKCAMEQDLYKKFALVLNEKKKKIRELQRELEETSDRKQSVFEICTDENTESSENCEEDENISVKGIRSDKRKLHEKATSEHHKKSHKTRRIGTNTEGLQNRVRENSPKASTSKSCFNKTISDFQGDSVSKNEVHIEKQNLNTTKVKPSILKNFMEEEPEDELF